MAWCAAWAFAPLVDFGLFSAGIRKRIPDICDARRKHGKPLLQRTAFWLQLAFVFLRNYPQSCIVAVEPSPTAFGILTQNVGHWPMVQAYNIGLHQERHPHLCF
jgi:hypothetical protein